jgi:hypothetical protein
MSHPVIVEYMYIIHVKSIPNICTVSHRLVSKSFETDDTNLSTARWTGLLQSQVHGTQDIFWRDNKEGMREGVGFQMILKQVNVRQVHVYGIDFVCIMYMYPAILG